MRDEKDLGTLEMPLPRKRGRPAKYGSAMTDAQRAHLYRDRRKADAMHGFFSREVSDAAMIDSLRYAMSNGEADIALRLLADLRSRVQLMKL